MSDHIVVGSQPWNKRYPVAVEAAVTAETFGNRVKRIYDVELGDSPPFNRLEDIQALSVVMVIAGMKVRLSVSLAVK